MVRCSRTESTRINQNVPTAPHTAHMSRYRVEVDRIECATGATSSGQKSVAARFRRDSPAPQQRDHNQQAGDDADRRLHPGLVLIKRQEHDCLHGPRFKRVEIVFEPRLSTDGPRTKLLTECNGRAHGCKRCTPAGDPAAIVSPKPAYQPRASAPGAASRPLHLRRLPTSPPAPGVRPGD